MSKPSCLITADFYRELGGSSIDFWAVDTCLHFIFCDDNELFNVEWHKETEEEVP